MLRHSGGRGPLKEVFQKVLDAVPSDGWHLCRHPVHDEKRVEGLGHGQVARDGTGGLSL